jgi:fumarate reductase flavoprotein subunit
MSETAKNHEYNLVVVGGGGAGLAAAVAFAEASTETGLKNIAVIEKRGNTGGTSAMASGIFAAESQVQKRQVVTAKKDDMFKFMMNWSHQSVNARIIRAYIDRSADTVKWLEDKGLRFTALPHSPIDNPLTWHVPRGNGAELMKTLAKAARVLGIEIFTNTSLKKIVTDQKGAATGVIAESQGKEITFKSKTIVIATGGFAGDKELLKKLCPRYRDNMALGGQPNMGDGIFKAYEAGAAGEGLGMLMIGGPFGLGAKVLTIGQEPDIVHIQMIFVTGEPSCLWLNKQGRRFINETASFNYYEGINSVIRQTDGISYAIFDSGLPRRITETGLNNVPSGFEFGERHRMPLPEGLEKELQKLADKDSIKISDKWEDIADWLGLDRRTLMATVTEYNADCARGYDPVFNKDRQFMIPLDTPPYYGVKMASSYLNTLGGIRINEKMEVLDKQDSPIKGLYCAGVDAGGWTSETYCAALPGTAFGWAINSGRIAGESAFRFIKGKK